MPGVMTAVAEDVAAAAAASSSSSSLPSLDLAPIFHEAHSRADILSWREERVELIIPAAIETKSDLKCEKEEVERREDDVVDQTDHNIVRFTGYDDIMVLRYY